MSDTNPSVPLVPPAVPEPVALRLDPRSTAFLVMDITDPLCTSRPRCVATVPQIASLLWAARRRGVQVIHTVGRAPWTILEPVAPQPDEPIVEARANKFHGSEMDSLLRDRGVTTLLLVGTAANGAIMYTAFAANVRGYTVAVAVDGISAGDGVTEAFAAWQLLNQPGFTNVDNEPLAAERVTLTRTDLVTFTDSQAGIP